MDAPELVSRIIRRKNERDALILVHNYQIGEVQCIADCLGDSLDLCVKAEHVDNRFIVFCGFSFTARSSLMKSSELEVWLAVFDGQRVPNSSCSLKWDWSRGSGARIPARHLRD